jgi:RNA polymerase sigma factor (sigma-70 family)
MSTTVFSTDGELLTRFAAGRDRAAFAEIVRRHGPLVMNVCRRLVRDPHLAEDVFQTTFLALAQKSRSVRKAASLGAWLHRVAVHSALEMREAASRRHFRERATTPRGVTREPEAADESLRRILNEELGQLPDKYRLPLVLCYLEGQTNVRAARLLGRPAGTMSTLLARGRELLRERLARRGVRVSGALLAALLSGEAAGPAASASLVAATVAASASSVPATALVLAKVKAASVALAAAGVLAAGAGTVLVPADPEAAREAVSAAEEEAARLPAPEALPDLPAGGLPEIRPPAAADILSFADPELLPPVPPPEFDAPRPSGSTARVSSGVAPAGGPEPTSAAPVAAARVPWILPELPEARLREEATAVADALLRASRPAGPPVVRPPSADAAPGWTGPFPGLEALEAAAPAVREALAASRNALEMVKETLQAVWGSLPR